MSLSNVESALIQAVLDGGFFDKKNIEFENFAFTPPSGEPWAKFSFVPGQPSVATLGDGGTDEVNGFVQVDINYPPNQGTAAAKQKADDFRKYFTAGKRFSYSGQEVIIASCGRSPGRIINSQYQINITIVFYSHITRNIT